MVACLEEQKELSQMVEGEVPGRWIEWFVGTTDGEGGRRRCCSDEPEVT